MKGQITKDGDILKKFSLLLLAVTLLLLTVSTAPATYGAASFPNTGTNGLTGFAGNAKNENGVSKAATTGGRNGQVVYVSNLNDLRTHMAGSTAKIVVVEQNISSSSLQKVEFGSNKTLVGSFDRHTLTNIHFRSTSGSSNVIFQNLTFNHSANINANDDIQMYITSGSNYWIDHVTFSGHSYSSGGSDLDKLLYIGDRADYITISNSKFANHKYGIILGHPNDGNSSYNGVPHVTMSNNYFENLYVRGPGLMRYGFFHIKNNYANNFNQAITIGEKARIYSENNYFGAGAEKGGILDDKGKGEFTDTGSTPALNSPVSPKTNWRPSNNYSYQVESAAYAREFVTKYAGSSNTTLVFGK
ncbi:pectin lyase [Paenibacillus amylolyticus]|uniref:Pectin lyase n=1 Tax=Paenibacillus amylolyticus TaxID=1451 RepID=A0A5M9WMR0_PAEAM|nr:pectin lyase [Paenibacillus amylolyticus]